jgi:hypothetical protein
MSQIEPASAQPARTSKILLGAVVVLAALSLFQA